MKKILSNYRYYVLAVLTTVAILGIFSAPVESLPPFTYYYTLVSSKLIGFAAAYIADRLIRRWEKLGSIPELINAKNNY